MPNPNTEGTAPVAPPPLATYPLRNGMAQLLTAARASHLLLPRGPPALLGSALLGCPLGPRRWDAAAERL